MAELHPQDTTAARQTLEQLSEGATVEPASVGLQDWWQALQQWVIDKLVGNVSGGALNGMSDWLTILAWILVPLLVVLLGYMAWRTLRPKAKGPDEAAEVSALPTGPDADTAEGAWLALQDVLQADPRHGALLLWKWACLRLTEQGRGTWHPEATWREFVATVPSDDARRGAVSDLGRALQRLAYGPAEPSSDDLKALLPSAQEVAA